jgi:hypothetical protein
MTSSIRAKGTAAVLEVNEKVLYEYSFEWCMGSEILIFYLL